MKTEKISSFTEVEEPNKAITNLKKGNIVKITVSDGSFEGVVQVSTDILLVVTLLKPMTSSNAHSYHWEAGSLKSVLFSRIQKLKRISFDSVRSIAA